MSSPSSTHPGLEDEYLSTEERHDSAEEYMEALVMLEGEHDGLVPISAIATKLWKYSADGAMDGLYTVALVASNDQGTGQATAVTHFQIGQGGRPPCGPEDAESQGSGCAYQIQAAAVQSPGAGIAVAAVLLAVAGIARARNGGI